MSLYGAEGAPSCMKSFLKRWFFTTVAVLVAAGIVPGIEYHGATGLITATLLLGILNAFVRPVMIFFTLPLVVFSLGLFVFIINAFLLWWVGHLLKNFQVNTFMDAVWGSLIISAVTMLLNILTRGNGTRVEFHKKPPPDHGGGPVIDV